MQCQQSFFEISLSYHKTKISYFASAMFVYVAICFQNNFKIRFNKTKQLQITFF